MRIFNIDKTIELSQVDLEKGYLVEDKLVIAHHKEIKGKTVEKIVNELLASGEICYRRFDGNWYKQIRSFPSGGTEEERIFLIEPQAAYDEYEDIQVYVPYKEEELKKFADEKRHAELKAELEKIKEDIEQETFGIVRSDFAEKKARAAEIVNELRVLEGKEPREVRE